MLKEKYTNGTSEKKGNATAEETINMLLTPKNNLNNETVILGETSP